MSAVVGQYVAAPSGRAGEPGRSPADRPASGDAPRFGDLVRAEGKPATGRKPASAGGQSAEAGIDAGPKPAGTDATANDGRQTTPISHRAAQFALGTHGKDVKDTQNDAKDTRNGAKNAGDDAENNDGDAVADSVQLPLVIALHDIRHQAGAGRNRAARVNDSGDALLPALPNQLHAAVGDAAPQDDDGTLDLSGKARKTDAVDAFVPHPPAAQAGPATPDDISETKVYTLAHLAAAGRAEPTSPNIVPSAAKSPLASRRAEIVSEQSFPAPAPVPVSQTAASLATAIASETASRAAASAPSGPAQPALPVAAATHILKIELHPAELGMVTASLRLSGEQLSIEIRPENHEAHRRLSSDSDAIMTSLRNLGFEVDKVTILQPSIATAPTARSDAGGSSTAHGGRDPSSFQSGASNGGSGGAGGQQAGRKRNDQHTELPRQAPVSRIAARGDLVI